MEKTTYEFISNHKGLCLATAGLAILGYLGYRLVKWIKETCGTTKKVNDCSQDVLSKPQTKPNSTIEPSRVQMQSEHVQSKGPNRFFTYKEAIEAIKPWGTVVSIVESTYEGSAKFIVQFKKPINITQKKEIFSTYPLLVDERKSKLLLSKNLIVFYLCANSENLAKAIHIGHYAGIIKDKRLDKIDSKDQLDAIGKKVDQLINDKDKAQMYLKYLTAQGLNFLKEGIDSAKEELDDFNEKDVLDYFQQKGYYKKVDLEKV